LSVTIGFGFLPFYMGDIAKLILAAAMMPIAWRFMGRK